MTIICFTQSFLLYRLDLLLRPSCTFVHEVCRPRREFEPLYCANALGIPVGLWGDVWWASDLSASINQVQEVTHKWPRPRFCSMLPCRFFTVLGCCLEPRVGIRMRKLGLEFRMCSQALMVRVASTPMTSCQYHLQPIHPSRQDGIWEVTVTLIDIGVLPGLVFGDTWAGGRREGKGGGICTGANCERLLGHFGLWVHQSYVHQSVIECQETVPAGTGGHPRGHLHPDTVTSDLESDVAVPWFGGKW